MRSLNWNTRTVAVAALVLAVASHLPHVALASGDPEVVDGVEPTHEGSTAFIMGDVATLLDVKDMQETDSAAPDELAKGWEDALEVSTQPRRFDFVFTSPRRAVETMFPMSWDVPLTPSTMITSVPRRSLRPCHHGGDDMMRYADLFSLTRARDETDDAPWLRPSMAFTTTNTKTLTTWVVCVDVIALLVTVVTLVIITVLAMLLLDLCMCCFGVRDGDDEDGPETADASTETLLPLTDSRTEKQKQFAEDELLVTHQC